MNKQQTAVNWLEEQLNSDMKIMQGHIIQDLLEQAKAMEKQQMKDAVLEQSTKHERLRKIFEKQFEEYYNETYEK